MWKMKITWHKFTNPCTSVSLFWKYDMVVYCGKILSRHLSLFIPPLQSSTSKITWISVLFFCTARWRPGRKPCCEFLRFTLGFSHKVDDMFLWCAFLHPTDGSWFWCTASCNASVFHCPCKRRPGWPVWPWWWHWHSCRSLQPPQNSEFSLFSYFVTCNKRDSKSNLTDMSNGLIWRFGSQPWRPKAWRFLARLPAVPGSYKWRWLSRTRPWVSWLTLPSSSTETGKSYIVLSVYVGWE